MIGLMLITFVFADTKGNTYTYEIWQNKIGEGYITVYDQNKDEVKTIRCASRPELSIIFNDGKVLFIVSYEALEESESDKKIENSYALHRLYRIDLVNGLLKIVDYSSPHARVSNDYQYLLFEYSEKTTGISHLRSKRIGDIDYIWDISSIELNGSVRYDDRFTGFNLLKVVDDGCIVKVLNQVNSDIRIKVFFAHKRYLFEYADGK
jgi:hypothetical protein